MICPRCSADNRDDMTVCFACGYIFSNDDCPAGAFQGSSSYCRCHRCGQQIPAGFGYCPLCGAQLSKHFPTAAIVLISIMLIFVAVLLFYFSSDREKSSSAVDLPAVQISAIPAIKPSIAPPVQTDSPAPTPTIIQGPGIHDIQGHDGRLQEPDDSSWLPDYETRYVQSSGGVSIYIFYKPDPSTENFDTVKEGTCVTVLAYENGYYLVICSDGRTGWCNSKYLVLEKDRIPPLPSFNGTYWIYTTGEVLSSIYSCRFNGDGTYSAYDHGGASYSEGTYSVNGRRLRMDGTYDLVWNGEYFISKKEYDMRWITGYYLLEPDHDASYETIRQEVQGGRPSSPAAPSPQPPPLPSAAPSDTEYSLPNGSYYAELVADVWIEGKLYIEIALLKLNGYGPSDAPILERTYECYQLPVADNCVYCDSSVFTDDGLTTEYYSSIYPIIDKYGYGVYLEIDVSRGHLLRVEKFYTP